MEYNTTFKGKPVKKIDCNVDNGKKVQAGVEGPEYEFGKIPGSEYVTCIHGDNLYLVLQTDKTVQCSCNYFQDNTGMVCEHILALRELPAGDFDAAPPDMAAFLEESEGWTTNAKGLLTPPSKGFSPEVVATLPAEDADTDEPPVEKPAPSTGPKKPLCVATCQFCEMRVKASTQEKADQRCANHEKVCKKRPAGEPDVSKTETTDKPVKETKKSAAKETPPMKEQPPAPPDVPEKPQEAVKEEPMKKAHPTPAAIAADTQREYKCKLCGESYPTADGALNCIEACQEKAAMEETRALIPTTTETTEQDWTTAQLEVMRKTVAIGATPAEFAYFLNVAKYSGLNPFLREIYFVKNEKGQVTIMTGRDGYLTIARRDVRFEGIQSMEVCENDNFAMGYVDGVMAVKTHEITDIGNRGKILGAWALGSVSGQAAVTIFASMDEYDKSRSPKGGNVWKQYTSSMIRKVAESMVLKRIGGISGLTTDAEVSESDDIIIDAEVV